MITKALYSYDGILYQIEYQPQLSKCDFNTEHKVYHIKTTDKDYFHAKKAIASGMEQILGYEQGDIWHKDFTPIENLPCLNPIHAYYDFSYDESLNMFVYRFSKLLFVPVCE